MLTRQGRIILSQAFIILDLWEDLYQRGDQISEEPTAVTHSLLHALTYRDRHNVRVDPHWKVEEVLARNDSDLLCQFKRNLVTVISLKTKTGLQ